MTCIVAIAQNNKVFMGADSCGSDGYSWQTVDNPKIFKVQDKFLIGCTTSFRMIDLLTYSLSVERDHPDDSDDKFMRMAFINGVRKCFKDGGFYEENKNTGGNFLVGYNGKLYEIQDDFSILNVSEFGSSVGSGIYAARGSLYTTRKDKDPKKRIRIALESAEAVVSSVRGPFIIESI